MDQLSKFSASQPYNPGTATQAKDIQPDKDLTTHWKKPLSGVRMCPAEGHNTELSAKVFAWILLQDDLSPAVKWRGEVSNGP